MALPSMTLAELRLACQQRADMVNNGFVSDAEWTTYINGSAYELYDILVGVYGDSYYASTHSFTTDGTSDAYALPADFYKATAVDVLSGGRYVALRRFNGGERDMSGPGTLGRAERLRYRLRGSTLWLAPMAAAGQTVRLGYVPRMTALSSESDSFDGISGWLDYVIVDAAIKALQKEESDVSVLFAQKQSLLKRIEAMAENRDAGSPGTVVDVTRRDDPDWWS